VLAACGSDEPNKWGPAPAELRGNWETSAISLTLNATDFTVTRGYNSDLPPHGSIGTKADQIEFFASSNCSGTGTYRWVVQGDSLVFSNRADPCGEREFILIGEAFTRVP
jgi:hypothetical protein